MLSDRRLSDVNENIAQVRFCVLCFKSFKKVYNRLHNYNCVQAEMTAKIAKYIILKYKPFEFALT